MGQANQITQSFKKKVIIKVDYVKKDGTCPLYIHISIFSSFERIPLKLSWSLKYFDRDAGRLLPRSKDDKVASEYQPVIDDEMATVNDITMDYLCCLTS